MSRQLTLDDIKDVRAYERERDEFRSRVIATKKLRRVHVGEIMTFVFENADTMRLQIQEMARAEKITSDEKILKELEIYNELIPGELELKATLMIELVSEEELRQWLPKLPGIQDHIHLEFDGTKISAFEPGVERLTREDEITTTVHYLTFLFTPDQKESFIESPGQVRLVIDHPHYSKSTELNSDSIKQLQGDLSGA